MTRSQRKQSERTSELRAAVDVFVRSPCKLSTSQTDSLLDELCVQLGWCLVGSDVESILTNPPTDPRAFAELVVTLDGGAVDDPVLFTPVLELVLKAFEDAARAAAQEGSESD